MKQVIRVSGKAKKVFKYIELLNRYKGNLSLEELEKEKSK